MRRPRGRRGAGSAPAPAGEDGFTAVEFAAGVGLLVLPVALLVMSLPRWVETQQAGRLAAQQAARAVVAAADHAEGLRHATRIADEILENLQVELLEPVVVDGHLGPVREAEAEQELVTVTVTVEMPALQLPLIGEWAAFPHAVSHTQPVDRYRGYR